MIVKTYGRHIVRVRPYYLLLDWVNLPDDQLLKRNPSLAKLMPKGTWLEEIRRSLQRAWDTEEVRDREFYLFSARWQYQQARQVAEWGEFGMHLIPAASNEAFHRAIFDLVESGAVRKLSQCAYKDCGTPYFIRHRRKKQPYCSTRCHGDALREIKRQWWAKNREKTHTAG